MNVGQARQELVEAADEARDEAVAHWPQIAWGAFALGFFIGGRPKAFLACCRTACSALHSGLGMCRKADSEHHAD